MPAVIQIKNRQIIHRRSYKIEKVGVIGAEDTVYPQHHEHKAEENTHILNIGTQSELYLRCYYQIE